ncbi:MAG: hypothetical protein AB7S59_04935 [Parvibaculaceae bacterium]
MSDASYNAPLSPWVRVLTGAALVVLIAGPLLLFAPAVIVPRWPWAITPFNARFLGAVYVAEFFSLLVLFIYNRWSPGRAALVVAFVFTFVVSIASLIHLSSFAGVRRVTVWFILYIGYALLPAGALLLYHRLPAVAPLAAGGNLSRIMPVAGVLLVLYGAALFVAPGAAAGFWPWPIDAMHGRIYSAVFLAPGIGLLLLSRSAAREEYLVGGVFLAGLGLFAILSFILAHLQTGRASFTSPGTWAWIVLFAAIGALGLRMIRAWRERS